ncbi:type VII secretion protein EccB [Nocardioides sp. URHA0020]|uniref:type VII secretion protein EccB n=1 Tax=Nocardioides sp. URHA0020 TaxID=1380392 RepID=UPI00048C82A2|nr:type VII secretion protein EccB [Nocardioides sp. URHA0020]
MATKKDLVEAYSFSRRRLVTAFVSGAPGGREVEPARPGRTIVGGLALAVLLGAGAAIAGVFSPTAPNDWKKAGLIISKDTGSAYVIIDESKDPELRPVINSTSAKLILGDKATPTLIAQDTIDDQRIGDDIGILGAPASVPTPSLLIDSGWTACTAADAGIKVSIAVEPDVTAVPQTGVTVSNGGDYFVVLPTGDNRSPGTDDPGAYVYPVPPQGTGGSQTDNLLSALDVQTTRNAIPVSREWINLFPTGAPLDWSSFEIDGFGTTPAYAAEDDTGVLKGKKVGDLLVAGKEKLLLTDDGPRKLSAFAALVYGNVIAPDGAVVAATPVEAPPQVFRETEEKDAATHWPAVAPTQEPIDEPCAQLTARSGKAPVAQLVAPGPTSGGADVPAAKKVPVVAAGRGAYVLSGGWSDTDQGSPFVVDAKGRANPLVGDGAAALLGYGDYPAAVVPDTWVKLFACGVNLSRDAALSPPGEPDDSRCA